MRIVRLSSENVKKLKAVHISPSPESGLVIIGGRNGQGKTSVLDSIEMALAGTKRVPKRPIRDGKDRAEVIVETEDYTVTRTFSQKGSTINIVGKDGMRLASPQTLLDSLVGSLSFDPLEFAKQKPSEQAATLRELTGLDFTEFDRQRQKAYDQRTVVNRDFKSAQERVAQLRAELPEGDIPSEPLDVSALVERLSKANQHNANNAARRAMARQMAAEVESLSRRVSDLKNALAEAMKKCDDKAHALELLDIEIAKQTDIDTDALSNEISQAGALNRVIENVRSFEAAQKEAAVHRERAQGLTKKLAEIDAEKQKRLAACTMPIDGLAFDEDGVTYKGLPFDQACDSEKLKVSLAMGLAMNPELRVVLIRDGSLLDAESLELVAAMATQADAQVWIERVGEGDEGAVIIEDGSVKA